jgi:hypothetical protein
MTAALVLDVDLARQISDQDHPARHRPRNGTATVPPGTNAIPAVPAMTARPQARCPADGLTAAAGRPP